MLKLLLSCGFCSWFKWQIFATLTETDVLFGKSLHDNTETI